MIKNFSPFLRDSQWERPKWLCALCGAEQYGQEQTKEWRGKYVCICCLAGRNEEEEWI